jgi:predicted enzyme related to lactoylglutathione lyase
MMKTVSQHFLGLRTVGYYVDDLEKAKQWYSGVLGFGPYFDEPFYVGFNVGGYELGLMPTEPGGHPGEGGTLVYWGVPDIQAAAAHLESMGASIQSGAQEVGEGIVVATFLDPFGNIFGIIENPHFKLNGN